MARPLGHDEDAVSTFWSFVGVLILVLAILGVYYGYVVPKFPAAPLRAQSGDQVRVDYIGTFADDGLVFDTSLASVAQDNASHPKAFMFSWRSSWTALGPFTIGAVPLAVVKGFDLGIQGLAKGESKTIVIPPDLGYGPADPSKIFVQPLFESVPVRLTMDATDFLSRYHTTAVSGANVTDPFWGWTAYVSVAGTFVTVTNSPVPGQMVRPFGVWDAQVVSIDDAANDGQGEILVHHLLDPSVVDRIGYRDSTGRAVFVVSAVDLDGGTFTLDYNVASPVGRTLIFQVTMVDISRLY